PSRGTTNFLSVDLGIAANEKYVPPKGLFEEYLLNHVNTDRMVWKHTKISRKIRDLNCKTKMKTIPHCLDICIPGHGRNMVILVSNVWRCRCEKNDSDAS
ncbi:MAG: hypothetical protein WCR02_12435, partial [Sphaerochaetaceae bacterium]